jgi:hypothetical protein
MTSFRACGLMAAVVALSAGASALPPSDDWTCLAEQQPGDRAPGPSPAGPPPSFSGAPDDGTLVDVLMLATPASVTAVGGAAAMDALVAQHVQYANDVRDACGITHRFRMVGFDVVSYAESGNLITDLARLKEPADGFMDDVHPLRDALGADLVCLLSNSGSAGTGYMMDVLSTSFEDRAFSAMSPTVASYVFAHETGHNMGLFHSHSASPPPTVTCYAFGKNTPDGNWRTIMADPPGTIVDMFSSPDKTWMGFPMGVDGAGCPPDAADAVRTLNDTAPFVANFRASLDGGSSFVDLGSGLAGAGGVPTLTGDGTLAPGSAGSVLLANAATNALAMLFVSDQSVPTPFKGGTLLPVPFLATALLTTSAGGTIPVTWTEWPLLPGGTEVFVQYAVQDAGAPKGAALSNALRGDVP